MRVGEWLLNAAERTLTRNGETQRLGPQQMQLLMCLAEQAGDVVSRAELLRAVWSDAIVEEAAVHRCVSEIRKALGDDPRRPRYIETIPKGGYRLIAPVLGPQPASPGSAGEPVSRSALWICAAALLVGSAAALIIGRSGMVAGSAELGVEGVRLGPSIAVLGFENLEGAPENNWLGTALSVMLATELSTDPELQIVQPEAVSAVQAELRFAGRGGTGTPVREIHQSLGSDFLIVGSFVEREGTIRVDVRVLDVPGAEPLAVFAETASSSALDDLVRACGSRLRVLFGSEQGAPDPALAATPFLPRDPAARRLYFAGLQKLRRYDAGAARELLERSLAIEEAQPLAHLARAEALDELGYQTAAMEASSRAVELAQELPREQRLWIEASDRAIRGQWERAIGLYRALTLFSPQTGEYVLRLAMAQNSAGRPEEVAATLASHGSFWAGDPRVELVAAESARLQGHAQGTLAAAERAETLAREVGAELLTARARHLKAQALRQLGRTQEALSTLEAAKLAFAAAGERRGEALVDRTMAVWWEQSGEFEKAAEAAQSALEAFREVGDREGEVGALLVRASWIFERRPEAAERIYEQALEIYRQIGNRSGELRVLNLQAVGLAKRYRFDEAEPLFEQTLALAREVGDRRMTAQALMNLGHLKQFSLELRPAEAYLQEAVRMLRELGNEAELARAVMNLATVHLRGGDLEASRRGYTEAVEIYRRRENPRMESNCLLGLGLVFNEQADTFRARSAVERALELRLAMGRESLIAEAKEALAHVLIEEGEVAAAVEMAREALELSGAPAKQEGSKMNTLAEAFFEAERYDAALTMAGASDRSLDPGRGGDDVRAQNAILRARIYARTGRHAEARALLDEALRETQRWGSWQHHVAAELAMAELALVAEDADTALRRARSVAATARERGWERIVRRAQRAASRDVSDLSPPQP